MSRRYKKYFRRVIRENFPVNCEYIESDVESHYKIISVDTQFASVSSNPLDRRLDFCAYFLALIKTLDQRGEPYEEIRRVCLEVVTAYVMPRNRIHLWMKKLPVKLVGTPLWNFVISRLADKIKVRYTPSGFQAQIVTDKPQTYGLGYGVDIIACGVCALFSKHKYEKYTPILCEVDKLTSSLAGLELIRSGTIATGAAKCDFRYRKA